MPARVYALCDDATCRLYAYEGVGVLLGQEELPAEEQHAYIAALLQPLIHQVHHVDLGSPV